ncbi:serine-threonine protein kinase 19-domain-containing protein, partial [Cercophora scortea]
MHTPSHLDFSPSDIRFFSILPSHFHLSLSPSHFTSSLTLTYPTQPHPPHTQQHEPPHNPRLPHPKEQKALSHQTLPLPILLNPPSLPRPMPLPHRPLRTTLLAHQHALAHLFDPIPPSLTSTHTAHLLQTRLAIPPLVSTSHIQSLLSLTPTAAERELSNLLQANTLRRITVPRRGAIGDLAILSADLNSIIRSHVALDDATKSSFISWLSTNPTAQTLPPDTLAASQLDALVRTGFLTALLHDSTGAGAQTLLRARPEDHSTLLSLSAVSRAAAGTLAAVGGDGAVHSAGGSGVRSTSNTNNGSRGLGLGLSITVPGIGTYLKLVAAALGHLRGLLEKTAYSEMAERDLR